MKLKTLTCPNCSQTNNFLAEDCIQCGINFSKYFEELEKAEALRRHIEEQERAEALRRRQAEEEDRKRREHEEAERELAARKQQEEAERAEALRLRQAEEEERRRREREAQEHEEAHRKLREDAERAEALRLRQAEEDRSQREREETKALDGEAVEPAPAPPRDAVDRDTHAASRDEPDEDETDEQFPSEGPASLERLLAGYTGQTIGLSYGDPRTLKAVRLLSVDRDHFSVVFPARRMTVSFPWQSLSLIVEGPDGISVDGPAVSPVFPVVVQVTRPYFA
ncbi:MAG: hypothetical protein ACOWWM_17240 [Desulfobacterales bacterium]